jgi:hypothetical protein
MTYHPGHGPQANLSVKRRTALKAGGTIGAALATLGLVEAVAYRPLRQQAKAVNTPLPDIQFDIGNFIAPEQTINGVAVRFGPVFTLFATARLTRTPHQDRPADAGQRAEHHRGDLPMVPDGIFTFVSYGIPYFNRLPGGLRGRLVSNRVMFQQIGLPRKVADGNNLSFAALVNPESPMWMGFFDQQVDASGPAAITTFAGNASARLTTARRGDYFDTGSIQHLSHVIQDLEFFYDKTGDLNDGEAETFLERVQYMFRSTLPLVSEGNEDQFTDGGGPSCLPNKFLGRGNAAEDAQGLNTEDNEHRIGHVSALQRSSRAADGTPIHIRMDGPAFDEMDVPDGSKQPKLQFTAVIPTADFFATMRRNSAALDLARRFDVEESDNGLERFSTATRRQNFLAPPRRHRAFPLLELT